jgi:hypothetical protein
MPTRPASEIGAARSHRRQFAAALIVSVTGNKALSLGNGK